jgi:hypothetical protein
MVRWLLTICIATCVLVACENDEQQETPLFGEAETAFRRGDYELAAEGYEDFVALYPQSPLVPLAEQRLRLIDRELNSVMGRRGSPSPVRVNTSGESTGSDHAPPMPRLEAPRLPSLGD